ncbi:MAG: B12-binding domain-containing radical SAM protein [Myxococcota bacterium]|nr:B12-binding domain-containing radical SAM protein [Myxococcota bacterium]
MNVLLAFPPGTDPRAPHLALPSLAATLRREGIRSTMLDLDVEGLVSLLSPESLARAGCTVRRAYGNGSAPPLRRLAKISDYLELAAARAIATLRDRVRFYDANLHGLARTTIADALDLVSAASGGVRYNIAPIAYDVNGVDSAKLRDLVAVTSDRTKNLFADHWEQSVFGRIDSANPGIVGISITNRQQLLPGLFLARTLRERGHRVVLGGTVLTKFVDSLKRHRTFFDHFADAIVVYEGETALLALVEAVDRGGDWSKVPNLLYVQGGIVRQNPTHVEDVDELPVPDFDGLPLDDYLAPERVLPILTGKGCYFNRCKFCDIPYINHVSKKAYRLRAPETVVEDCRTLQRRFGCRHFEITDEALSPKLLERFVKALEPHASDRFCFVGYARLEPGFTPGLCRKLADAGFKKLFFGLESASQETLDHMDKGVDVRDAPVVLKNMRDAGIHFHLFSIIGFPEETAASAEETFQFFVRNADVIDHPGNSFDIHPFGLELRTRYFAEAGSMGVVISPDALKREFVLGLPEGSWSSTSALGANVSERIGVYMSRLRRLYGRYHNCPGHLWPGYEEYAVLYADRYGADEFPFATQLPPPDDRRTYRAELSPLTCVETDGARVRLRGRDGVAETTEANYRFVTERPEESFADTVRALNDVVPPGQGSLALTLYRDYVHSLIGRGLASVRLQPRLSAESLGDDAP